MTTPGGWTPPTGDFIIPAGVGGSGLAGHAAMSETDWRASIEADHRPHWEGVGGPIQDLQEWVQAIISVFQGDPGPLGDLVGEALDALPGVGPIISAIRGTYTGDDPHLIDLANWAAGIRQTFDDLIAALHGNYTGSDPVLAAASSFIRGIQNAVDTVADFLLGLANAIISGIRRVPVVGGSIADRLQDVINVLTGNVNRQNDMHAAVYQGASNHEEPVVDDLEPAEVENAVAALRNRADTAHQVRELAHSRAVPIWAGLAPGGDVTIPLHAVRGMGSIYPGLVPIYGLTGQNWTVATLIRPTSDSPKKVISFLGRLFVSGGSNAEVWINLSQWNPETDRFTIVGQTGNLTSQFDTLDTDNLVDMDWVHAELLEEVPTSVGDLYLIQWCASGGAQVVLAFGGDDTRQGDDLPPLLPVSDFMPYGTVLTARRSGGSAESVTRAARGVGMDPFVPYTGGSVHPDDATNTLPDGSASSLSWLCGPTPYAHLSPDLGQAVVPEPVTFYDTFGGDFSGRYYLFGGARGTGDRWSYYGTTDGIQGIISRTHAATDRMQVAATLSSPGSSSGAYLFLHAEAGITRDRTAFRPTKTVALHISPNGNVILEHSRDHGHHLHMASGNTPYSDTTGRWSVSYEPDTRKYTVAHRGTVVLTWTDSSSQVRHGSRFRYGGVGSVRSFFSTGGSWDDLLIRDLVDEE